MGKTSKPLCIVVHRDLWNWAEIQALKAQGHEISMLYDDVGDIILAPTAWRMDEDHREYLDLAISEARKVRYPKEGKDDTTGDS